MKLLFSFLVWLVVSVHVQAADFRIATFNTESDDDTQPAKVAETIAFIGAFDILAVQEVESSAAMKAYAEAAALQGGQWRYVVSESGVNQDRQADLLGIVYRIDRFPQLETNEIHVIRSKPEEGTEYGKPDWSLRGALTLRLLDTQTGVEFRVATVHLKCCNEPATRAHQAALLAKELAKSSVQTIVLGDTNIPIEPGDAVPNAANRPAFDSLGTSSGRKWLVPTNPVKTQCSPAFNSMLDQIYVPDKVATSSSVKVLFPEATYCDKDEQGYSDHRPLVGDIKGLTGSELEMHALSATTGADLSEEQLESRESDLQAKGRFDDITATER